MGRLSFTIFLLAALSSALAGAAPVSPEKTHRHISHKSPTQSKAPREAANSRASASRARRTAGSIRRQPRSGYLRAGHASHPPMLRRRSPAPQLRSAVLIKPRTQPGIEPATDSSPEPATDPITGPGTEAKTEPTFADSASSQDTTEQAMTADTPAPTPPVAVKESSLSAADEASFSVTPAAPTAASLRIPRGYVAPLKGSHESLVRQNVRSEAEGLERIEDEVDLNDRIARRLLVPVPVSSGLTVNANLPEDFRYCRPWTARFLADLARAHDLLFHRPIVVSSAVRTVAYQKQLERINGNAAPAEGDIVSPHLTGGTIDIAKEGLPRKELAWMRAWLAPLQADGKIDVEEEFQQACFHITVYESYVPPPAPAAKPHPRTRRRRSPSVANALAVKAM
jgi:hypothetical protein